MKNVSSTRATGPRARGRNCSVPPPRDLHSTTTHHKAKRDPPSTPPAALLSHGLSPQPNAPVPSSSSGLLLAPSPEQQHPLSRGRDGARAPRAADAPGAAGPAPLTSSSLWLRIPRTRSCRFLSNMRSMLPFTILSAMAGPGRGACARRSAQPGGGRCSCYR